MALVRQARPERLRLDEAIQQFQATLEPPYVAQFASLQSGGQPKPSDVFKLTEEVNRNAYKIHKTWRQYGSRLQKALDQIVVFTKVGDVLVGGSQNMIACGVWAAVRLSIQIAAGYLSFFDKVSNLWMRIGRSCEVQEDLVQLFPQSNELQTLMSDYLIVTVNFCRRIIAFAKRRLISQIASTFSIAFDKEFNEFEAKLGHLAKLMNQRAKILATQVALESSKRLVTTTKLLALGSLTARRRDYEQRRAKLLKRLCPLQDWFNQRQRHERKRGPVRWVFEDPNYQKWERGNDAFHRPCVLSGNIGSGKTVVAANIISTLQADRDPGSTTVAGFFCCRDDPRTLEAEIVIGSIVHQFVRGLGSTADRAVNRYTPEDTTPGEVCDLTLKALPKDREYFVIIDALEECKMDNMTEVVQYFARLRVNPDSPYPRFRLLYSCRTDSALLPLIKSLYSSSQGGLFLDVGFFHISMSNNRRDEEIEAFITSEITYRRHIRNLSPQLEAAVRAALIAGAQGMFLWVALQLEIIFPRHHHCRTLTDSDLILLLDRLPRGLSATYDHALEHISDVNRAKRAFQLIGGSERPLGTSELAVAVNIEPGNTYWDHSAFPLDPDALVWTCGGGILEVMEEDDTVHYIHHSALRHLLLDGAEPNLPTTPASKQIQQVAGYKFKLEDACTVLAAVCVTFLSYKMHDHQLAKCVNAVGDHDIIDAVSAFLPRSQAATTTRSLTTKLIERVLDRRKRTPSESVTSTTRVFTLVTELARQGHQEAEERAIRQFLEYASQYWLEHTKNFIDPSDIEDGAQVEACVYAVPAQCYRLFSSLVRSESTHIGPPWHENTDSARIQWALETGHVPVYRVVMHLGFGHGPRLTLAADSSGIYKRDTINTIAKAIHHSPERVRIAGKEIGAILALNIFFETTDRAYSEFIPRKVVLDKWVACGVDLDAPLVASAGSLWSPLCLLLRYLGAAVSRSALFDTCSDFDPVNDERVKIYKGTIHELLKMRVSVIGFSGNTLGGPRPLFMALDLGLGDVVRSMVKMLRPDDVSFKDEAGRTLLGLAIMLGGSRDNGADELLKCLLVMGADTCTLTACWVPLPGAYYYPRPGVVLGRFMKALGSEENLASKVNGMPPLVLAATRMVPSVFELLLYHHTVDLQQTYGGRAIHECVDSILSPEESVARSPAPPHCAMSQIDNEMLAIWHSAKAQILRQRAREEARNSFSELDPTPMGKYIYTS